MLNLKVIGFTSLFCFNLAYAESDMSDVSLSKAEVNKSLDMLQSQGQFSAEEIKKAREALEKMDSQSFNSLNNKAHNLIKNDPETAKKMAKSLGE